MTAPYSSIEERLEDALKSFIESLDDPGVKVARAFTGDPVEEPMVGIFAESSSPTIPDATDATVAIGIRDVTVRLMIRSHSDEQETEPGQMTAARDAHSQLVGRVLDLFFRDDVVAAINQQSIQDLTVQNVTCGDRTRSVADHSFLTEQTLVITCHAEGATP